MYGSAPGAMQLTGKAEELCIAADASDNGKFFAIVMGLCVDVERLHKRLCSSFGAKEIHMRELLPGQRKEEVVRLMDSLGTSAVHMYCLEIDKQGQFMLCMLLENRRGNIREASTMWSTAASWKRSRRPLTPFRLACLQLRRSSG